MSDYVRRAIRVVYENQWIALEAHEIVYPGGGDGEHAVVRTGIPSGVVVLDGPEVVLVRQPRYAAGLRAVEIVKGTAEAGEDALVCARREAAEEVGATGGRWTALGFLYEIPSIVAAPIRLFLARNCRFGPPAPERVETLETVRLRLDEAVRQALEGGLDDAVSVAALARAQALLRRGG